MHSIIDQLVQQGVTDFFFAPGSRSTPLAAAASRAPGVKLYRHYDERGLGFYALGCALGKERAAAVITTSGTAVGNLLPAVMEAHHSSIPLLLLTADRPPELRYSSANQTTDQIKIFQNFVRFQFDLDSTMAEKAIRSKIAEAVFHAHTPHPGPVHLNCPFREPLYPLKEEYTKGKPIHLKEAEFAPLPSRELPEKGIILIGRLPKKSDIHAALQLAKELKWPIFADLLSSARAFSSKELIRHFDYLLTRAPKVDCVLHFGERFTSKRLMEWLSHNPPSTYLHISPHSHWNDPFYLMTERIYADIHSLSFFTNTPPTWLSHWQQLDRQTHEILNRQIPFTETSVMKQIAKEDLTEWGIFLANSMPIREAEWFLFPKAVKGFFANRGLSGIDGNIATIAGLCRGLNHPILGIVGDLTALHDLNSLPLLKDLPIVLIVSNNDGCGIFSHLPVASDPHFEALWGFSHGITFKSAAHLFGLPYFFADSETSFSDCFSEALTKRNGCILEVATSRKENIALHKQLKCSTQ